MKKTTLILALGMLSLCNATVKHPCSNEIVTTAPPGVPSNPSTWAKGNNCTTGCQCSAYYQLGAVCLPLDRSELFSACIIPY